MRGEDNAFDRFFKKVGKKLCVSRTKMENTTYAKV